MTCSGVLPPSQRHGQPLADVNAASAISRSTGTARSNLRERAEPPKTQNPSTGSRRFDPAGRGRCPQTWPFRFQKASRERSSAHCRFPGTRPGRNPNVPVLPPLPHRSSRARNNSTSPGSNAPQPGSARRPLAVVAVSEGLELWVGVRRPVPQPLGHVLSQAVSRCIRRDQVPVADGVRPLQVRLLRDRQELERPILEDRPGKPVARVWPPR